MRLLLVFLAVASVHCTENTTFTEHVVIKAEFTDACSNPKKYVDLACGCLRTSNPDFVYKCSVFSIGDTKCVDGSCACTNQTDMYINVTALTNASVDMGSAKTCDKMPDVFKSMDSDSGLDPVVVIVLSVLGGCLFCFVVGLGVYSYYYGCPGCQTNANLEGVSVAPAQSSDATPSANEAVKTATVAARRFLGRISGHSIDYKIIPP
jgi:hypothetical protein